LNVQNLRIGSDFEDVNFLRRGRTVGHDEAVGVKPSRGVELDVALDAHVDLTLVLHRNDDGRRRRLAAGQQRQGERGEEYRR
jgi:hypothetical protein